MDLPSHYFHNQKNNYEYPRDNIKPKKSRKSSPRKNNTHINNNNILQFSLNAINNILINNLNSSVSLGFLNLINDNSIPNLLNNDIYINSLHDTIDYKIRGNIYKPDKKIFNNFPNLMPLLINKSCKKINRNEIKIMKLDKDIINPKNKTPIKRVDKHYYLNLMQNNGINTDKYMHYKNNSENIDNNIDFESEEKKDIKKSKKINNFDKYTIYRTCTTINSKEKNRENRVNNYQNNIINQNQNAYKKKSPTKKYIINKTSLNSKEKNIRENKAKLSEPKNQISFKNKFIYKVVKTTNNSPKQLILVNKNKENILKNKNKEILTKKKSSLIIPSQLQKQIKHDHSQSYNINTYKPIPNSERNTYCNMNTHKINDNTKKIVVNKNNYKTNKIKYLSLVNLNNNKNNADKIQKNKNLNIKYIPPSNNFKKISTQSLKQMNNNKYASCNKTINNSNNSQKITNDYYANKNNNHIQRNNNNVFEDDESSIFKVIDYTQIMTTDEFSNSKNSLMNSNKLNQLSGSNGTNTNQDTDYNSLKKFNYNNNILTNEDFRENNYYNSGNDVNFSFNNL